MCSRMKALKYQICTEKFEIQAKISIHSALQGNKNIVQKYNFVIKYIGINIRIKQSKCENYKSYLITEMSHWYLFPEISSLNRHTDNHIFLSRPLVILQRNSIQAYQSTSGWTRHETGLVIILLYLNLIQCMLNSFFLFYF